ncbi:spore germination protein [Sediminibacillus halophilus]|uniref:Spore germination protein KA n=1 Tax=Sediminibacillus halophilus TaxID=482461 RepID=A0A1G9W2J7_9BACI|nr:spore germination protein [Sediminibacillus halophilus]SDM78416.1 spore germination protein KA [Sediminibacillus halophilus]
MKPFKSLRQKPKEQKQKTERNTTSLQENITYFVEAFHRSDDLKLRILEEGRAVLFYLESLADQAKIQNEFFKPYMKMDDQEVMKFSSGKKVHDRKEIIKLLLKGHSAFAIDGSADMLLFNTTSAFNRSVEEPDNEKVVRGSHEGFIDNLMININLIRKRIENENLVVTFEKLGKLTNTKVALVYLDGVANPQLVDKVKTRLKDISVDFIISPGFIEEFIEDHAYSPFPQMINTERPDKTVANLMEGRVAVLSEGSSTCLMAPATFFAFYQSPDDYNSRWFTGTFIRLIRLFSFIIAIGLPAFYISIVGFHFEVIPKDLVIPVKSSINEIAYPPIIEALVMVIIIELIREAGIRLPTPVGQTIGIVGGLVIGDAIVRAGLVSNFMIIVVALTAIASFVVPSNEMSTTLRLLTFPLIILSATLGFVGIVFGMLLLLIHLSRMESFGTPYFAPLAPLHVKDLKDTFIRLPLFKMNTRPKNAKPIKGKTQATSREWRRDGKNRK